MMLSVFIHTNDRQYLGALVAAHAFMARSAHPDRFDVRIIRLEEHPALHGREGQTFLREGQQVTWRNDDLQSFTPLRFLPPQLMGYQGRAVIVDPDVFACGDVYELLTRDMGGKAVMCRQLHKKGRQEHATSVMLLDCDKLAHWRWEAQLEAMFAGQLDYRDWLTLAHEPEGTIGALEEVWNHFDALTPETRLLHNTQRATQPWKTGLPIEFTQKAPTAPGARKWGVIPYALVHQVRAVLKSDDFHPDGTLKRYQPHPDPQQERQFFSLLKECLERGTVTRDMLEAEIRQQHVRSDALAILEAIR